VDHLDAAAGQTEGHRPDRAGAGPIDQILEIGDQKALFVEPLGGTRQKFVLRRARRQRCRAMRVE